MREGWADWQLMEPLSSGSSGIVYRACQKRFPDVQSAIKVIGIPPDPEQTEELRKSGLSDEQIRSMYQRKTEQIIGGIRQMERFKGMTHLVSVEDFRVETEEEERGPGCRVWIRMELLKPLKAYLADKTMSEAETLRMGIDLCSALEILHSCGVIHQDIKPDNIFVNDRLPTGAIFKLGDLDSLQVLSEEAPEAAIRGTPSWLAPEIPAGKAADERTDLYALGLTLYQMVNEGRLPFLPERQFSSHHDLEIAAQTRLTGMELPAPAGASGTFLEILRKACAFRPEDRYASAAEMRTAMEELLESYRGPEFVGTPAKPADRETNSSDNRPKSRKNLRKKAVVLAAAALLLICGILVSGVLKHPPGSGTENLITESAGQNAAVSALPEASPVPVPENPLTERIYGVQRQLEEKGILPADPVYHIPLSLEALPALTEMDAFLSAECDTWPLKTEGLDPVPIDGKRIGAWKNKTGTMSLEAHYSEETGEMTSWVITLLLEDRANGINVIRDLAGKGCWHITWYPPLRTYVIAEYSPGGALSTLSRGNQTYTAEELPILKGVEYIP